MSTVSFVCEVGTVVPNVGDFVAGQTYEMDRELAEQLAERGHGQIAQPKSTKRSQSPPPAPVPTEES